MGTKHVPWLLARHLALTEVQRPSNASPSTWTRVAGSRTTDQDIRMRNDYNSLEKVYRHQLELHRHAMKKYYALSQNAYNARDGQAARELSNKGREHEVEYEKFQKKVNALSLYTRNHRPNAPNQVSVDLHGVNVTAAEQQVRNAVESSRSVPGATELTFITGKGMHSEGRRAVLLPLVRTLLHDLGVPYKETQGGVVASIVPELPADVRADLSKHLLQRSGAGRRR